MAGGLSGVQSAWCEESGTGLQGSGNFLKTEFGQKPH